MQRLGLPLGMMMLAGCGLKAIPDTPPNATDAAWTCDNVGIYGPRQLRLLTRREYQNTIRALFAATPTSCTQSTECELSHQSCTSGVCVEDTCTLATFILSDSSYSSVTVAGSFNGWEATAWPLSKTGDQWWLKADVGEGSFQYKFVVNGSTWIPDPNNPDSVDDGYGGRNSVLTQACNDQTGEGLEAIATLDLTANFPPESRPEHFPFDDNAAAGLVSSTLADAELAAAEQVANLAITDIEGLSGCDPNDDVCAEDFIRQFGARVFRRPLTEVQVDRYLNAFLAETDRTQGWSILIQSLLSSPYFLYRSEMGVDQGDGHYALDDWELASALSYFLWAAPPDDELRRAAAAGELQSEAGLKTQAERMIADPQARANLAIFAQQWLGVEPVLSTSKAKSLPEDIRAAMLQEAGDFVAHVAYDGTGELNALYTADYTIASPALATWYGLGSPDAAGILPTEGLRSGVLGLGAVLSSFSHSDQSSPIRRGVFVRDRLLCEDLGTPPANAASIPVIDPTATTRERFSQHSSDPFCASCHGYIDEVGFGLEHLDERGLWRDDENGLPIDASGNMNDIEYLGQGKDNAYNTLPELGSLLAESERVAGCYTVQTMRYALGWRPEEMDELCAYDAVRLQFEGAHRDLRSLLLAVVVSEPFRIRE